MKKCEGSCSCPFSTREWEETELTEEEVPLTYKEIRHTVFAKLINTRENLGILNYVPHHPVLDLSLVYYYFLHNDPDSEEQFVTNSMLKLWEVSEEQIFEDAMENTKNIMGKIVRPLTDVIDEMVKNLSCGIDLSDEEERLPMYVLTNLWKKNGAVCILFQDTARELAEMLDCDLYVIPSSIHEVILVPTEGGPARTELDQLIRKINETELSPADVLSDHSYIYSRKLDRIVL